MTCSTPDCHRAAKSAGLCWACRKRRQRGVALGEVRPWGNPWETLMAAVKAWASVPADESGDDAFVRKNGRLSRVEGRIAKAAIRFAAAQKRGRASRSRQMSNMD